MLYKSICVSPLSMNSPSRPPISNEFKHIFNDIFNSFISYLIVVKDVTDQSIRSDPVQAGEVMSVLTRNNCLLDDRLNAQVREYIEEVARIRPCSSLSSDEIREKQGGLGGWSRRESTRVEGLSDFDASEDPSFIGKRKPVHVHEMNEAKKKEQVGKGDLGRRPFEE